jgi:hypothetical protein
MIRQRSGMEQRSRQVVPDGLRMNTPSAPLNARVNDAVSLSSPVTVDDAPIIVLLSTYTYIYITCNDVSECIDVFTSSFHSRGL